MTDATGTIEAESLRQSLIAYREAAGVWLESVGRLGVSERQIADRLAIGRMILHRLRRFVQADDAISLLEHLPGGRARAEIAETRLPDRLNAVAVADRLITATRDLAAILQRVGPDRIGPAPLERRVDLGFGEVHPNAGPMEGSDEDDAADFILPTFFPVRQAVMELWLHRTRRRAPESPRTSMLQDYRFTPHLGSDMVSPNLEQLGDFSRVEDPLEPSDGLLGC